MFIEDREVLDYKPSYNFNGNVWKWKKLTDRSFDFVTLRSRGQDTIK